jgi:cation transport ATPase
VSRGHAGAGRGAEAPIGPPERAAQLMTPERRIEALRITAVGVITLLYWRQVVGLPVLLGAVAVGLYPLLKIGIEDLVKEHRIGTEIVVSLATGIALLGEEYVAASVLMTIILIAKFIADFNTDRARASIRRSSAPHRGRRLCARRGANAPCPWNRCSRER